MTTEPTPATTSSELATSAGAGPQLPALSSALVDVLAVPRHWTSLDLKDQAQRVIFARMLDFGSENFIDLVGTTLEIEHIGIMARSSVNPDTGEVTTVYATLLVTPTGQVYGGTSQGVRSSVSAILACYGVPPWRPPVIVDFKQVQLDNVRRPFRLANPRRATDPTATNPKRK